MSPSPAATECNVKLVAKKTCDVFRVIVLSLSCWGEIHTDVHIRDTPGNRVHAASPVWRLVLEISQLSAWIEYLPLYFFDSCNFTFNRNIDLAMFSFLVREDEKTNL